MKRKRVQYNELNEEIYEPKNWSKTRLVFIGLFLLTLGFLANFSLEEKLNKFLQKTLSTNPQCPIQFEKTELSYFLPKIILKKPVILGICFGEPGNRLSLKDIKISLHSPSFYPPGLNFHVEASSGKTTINLYPAVSLFTQLVEIEKTTLDAEMFSVLTENNRSPLLGLIKIEGFLKFESGKMTDGQLSIHSNNFSMPAQNLKGFDFPNIKFNSLQIKAHFSDKTTINIEKFQLGENSSPIEIQLKGKIKVTEASFMNSNLSLDGQLKLSPFILSNFSFIKLFLPENNTSGTYKMILNGPLRNPGAPRFN